MRGLWMNPDRRSSVKCALWAVVLAAAAGTAHGQPDQPPPTDPPQAASRDFWFAEPRGWLGVRGGWLVGREGSDLFDFIQDQLTIDGGDLNAPTFALDLGVVLSPRFDVVAGFDLSRAKKSSEYRDYVDNNLQPIEQDTTLNQTQLTGSVRYLLTPRGRRISRYAWIPATFTPYVGAGGGIMWYRFEQTGDFVDYEDLSVFYSRFESSGTSPTAHVFGGLDIQAFKRLFLTVEGRFTWASGDLSEDFVDFDPIDLAGFRLSGGISLVF